MGDSKLSKFTKRISNTLKSSGISPSSGDAGGSSLSTSQGSSPDNQMSLNIQGKVEDKPNNVVTSDNSTSKVNSLGSLANNSSAATTVPSHSNQSLVKQQSPAADTKREDSSEASQVSGSVSSKNDKQYVCSTCGKVFSRKHNMVSHELIHSQTKPHTCSVCSATFRRIHDLKRHEKLHTGEKPFKCEYCPRSFARPDSLTRHQNSPNACPGYTKAIKANSPIAFAAAGSYSVPSADNTIAVSEGSSSGSATRVKSKAFQDFLQTSHPLYQQPPKLPQSQSFSPGMQGERPELPPLRSISNISRGLDEPYYSSKPRGRHDSNHDQSGRDGGIETLKNNVDDRNAYTTTTTITTTHYETPGSPSNNEERKRHSEAHQKAVQDYKVKQDHNSNKKRRKTQQTSSHSSYYKRPTDTNHDAQDLRYTSQLDNLSKEKHPYQYKSSSKSDLLPRTDGDYNNQEPEQNNEMTNVNDNDNDYDNFEGGESDGYSENDEGSLPGSMDAAGPYRDRVKSHEVNLRNNRFYHGQMRNTSMYPKEEYISLSRYQDLVAYTQSLEENLNRINNRIQLLEDESADTRIERERAKQANDAKERQSRKHSKHRKSIHYDAVPSAVADLKARSTNSGSQPAISSTLRSETKASPPAAEGPDPSH